MNQSLIIFSLLIILSGCELATYNPNGTEPTPTPVPDIESIVFKPDPTGDIQFKTNDTIYCIDNGTTIWKTGTTTETTMTKITVDTAKMSGVAGKGFGVLFCVQDNSNYLGLLMDIEGWFMPIRCVNKSIETLEPSWTYTDKIQKGYNTTNTIEVEYVGSNSFEVRFNETLVKTFILNTLPFFTGGKFGYIVSIANNEDFPITPVDVRFRQITPVDIGINTKSIAMQRCSYDKF